MIMHSFQCHDSLVSFSLECSSTFPYLSRPWQFLRTQSNYFVDCPSVSSGLHLGWAFLAGIPCGWHWVPLSVYYREVHHVSLPSTFDHLFKESALQIFPPLYSICNLWGDILRLWKYPVTHQTFTLSIHWGNYWSFFQGNCTIFYSCQKYIRVLVAPYLLSPLNCFGMFVKNQFVI